MKLGETVVVVAGGDGTICEAVQGLHDAGGAILGILPLGTGNDAARTVGVPVNLEAAAQVIAAGTTRRVDLMRAGDRVVLNAIGIGLLGAINVNSTNIKIVRGIDRLPRRRSRELCSATTARRSPSRPAPSSIGAA